MSENKLKPDLTDFIAITIATYQLLIPVLAAVVIGIYGLFILFRVLFGSTG